MLEEEEIEMRYKRELLEEKMNERGFVVYATVGMMKLQFVSKHMYNSSYVDTTPPRQRKPVINIIVNLETEEFQCVFNLNNSIDTLNAPVCGSVMSDKHFDRIVTKFESEAKWMSMLN